jgi:hypothetical protein
LGNCAFSSSLQLLNFHTDQINTHLDTKVSVDLQHLVRTKTFTELMSVTLP